MAKSLDDTSGSYWKKLAIQSFLFDEQKKRSVKEKETPEQEKKTPDKEEETCEEEKELSDEDLGQESNDTALDDPVVSVKTKDNVKKDKPPILFRCEICLTECENAKILIEHLDEHDFQYSCKTCDANFKLTLDFIDHVREHSTDKLYKCPLCEFKIEKRNKMTLHLQLRHDQFRKYRCEICKIGFTFYSKFLEHKFTHINENPFKCDIGNNSLAKIALLQSHSLRMHIVDPISCDVCQKLCKNKTELRTHKISHDIKPICEECGKTLSSKEKLRDHTRTHTGEKPFICNFCPKSFTTSSFRSSHERTHTGDKPHICSICNKGFAQRTSMKIHETTHRTDNPFQCNICAKQFKSKIMYNKHLKKCSLNSAVQPQVKKEEIGKNVLQSDINLEVLSSESSNNYVPLEIDQDRSSREVLPINLQQPTNPSTDYDGSINQLPIQNVCQESSEMDYSQQNQQESNDKQKSQTKE